MAWTLTSAFLLALAVSAGLTPVVIWLARAQGWVVAPREDRWHQKPTAVYGGVAIFLAFGAAFWLLGVHTRLYLTLLVCAGAMFSVGLYDDAREMKPQVKFICQLVVALVAVSQGIRLDKAIIPWAWLAVPLTVFWLVGVTNAVNILDNMDGLSSGVVCVAGLVLALGAAIEGTGGSAGIMAAMLAGAAGGFLIYNFNPAKIFMGDCGSLFLGFTLAATTILSANTASQASHLAMALLVPLGALVVPIFDTTLVSFQRTSHGRSIAQGGRDHSSHRLVFLGLSERRSVLTLLFISLAGGLGSLMLSRMATPLIAAVIVALIAVGLVSFGIYLGEVKVYEGQEKRSWLQKSPILSRVLLFKKQILQIAADLVLVSAAYAAAWLLRFEGQITDWELGILATTLPLLLAAKMTSFWLFGLYRGEWRYLSVHDLMQMAKANLTGSAITVLIFVLLYGPRGFSRAVMVLDFLLGYVFIAGARGLLRVFREKVRGRHGVPVLIMGAGDGGELLLRELRNNPRLAFVPVGFVDDDPAKQGHLIHGVKVLGTRHDLTQLIHKLKVERVFISILSSPEEGFEEVFDICATMGVECSRIQPMIKF
jgi:UDP-GlcNAc:undecaprenyl-phosphate GlcNAc-1-phosphate transferase